MKYITLNFFAVLTQLLGLSFFHYLDEFLLSTAIFFVGTLTLLGSLYTKKRVSKLETYLIIITSLTIVVLAVEAILLDTLVDYRLLMILYGLGLVALPFTSRKRKAKKRKKKKKAVKDYSTFNTDEGKRPRTAKAIQPKVMDEEVDEKGDVSNVQINVKNEYGGVKEPNMYFVAPSGKSFHEPNCSTLNKSKREKYKTFETRKEAMKEGYKPCKLCRP